MFKYDMDYRRIIPALDLRTSYLDPQLVMEAIELSRAGIKKDIPNSLLWL